MAISLCMCMHMLYTTAKDLKNFLLESPFTLFIFTFIFASMLVTNFYYSKEFWQNCLFPKCSTPASTDTYRFDYGLKFGPHNWKNMFPRAQGSFQSPINIKTSEASLLKISERIIWNHYEDLPLTTSIENNGKTVVLRTNYEFNNPTIAGADLLQSYIFDSARFRWSFLDGEGSEHAIDNMKYPMELQATHISRSSQSDMYSNMYGDIGILIISYFFAITKYDNPYLDPITSNLHLIRRPGTKVEIPPFPLSWLCYPFKTGFYSYGGSLSEPPCTEGVTWFVHPEPMAISIKQIIEFRSLLGSDNTSRIMRNFRPVQNVNGRLVCYNRYDPVPQSYENGDEEDEEDGDECF